MPKHISAADLVPTLLAMVMLDRRRALMGDSCDPAGDDRTQPDAAGPTSRPAAGRRRDRRGEFSHEARA